MGEPEVTRFPRAARSSVVRISRSAARAVRTSSRSFATLSLLEAERDGGGISGGGKVAGLVEGVLGSKLLLQPATRVRQRTALSDASTHAEPVEGSQGRIHGATSGRCL